MLAYVRWWHPDAMRNSVGMLVTHRCSHRTLAGVPVSERKAMLADESIRW